MTPWQWYWIDRADSLKNLLFFLSGGLGLLTLIMLCMGSHYRENEKELSPNFVFGTMLLIWARRLAFATVIGIILYTLLPQSHTLCKMNPRCVWTTPPPPPQNEKGE